MTFNGFPKGEYGKLDIPPMFFGEWLPQIDDLSELKIMLFCLWALPQKEKPPYLTYEEFLGHTPFMAGLHVIAPHLSPEALLDSALQKSLARGTLLEVRLEIDNQPRRFYFLNTDSGREVVRRIAQGEWRPSGQYIEILPEKPNIYKLYLENVGALTPMITDELKDAERDFSADWVAEAIEIAVRSNKRNIKYIRAILERWRREGKYDGKEKRQEQDWRSYLYDEFGNPLK
ncbi:MAG: DnaD domain protein [Anaerolineae bacterium]|jgi:DnaD/phage-associated family protein|nr:DnaD domain protein [Anaerolineae bacterium]